MDVVTSAVPGVAGSVLQDVRAQERPVFVPVLVQAPTLIAHLDLLSGIRDLVDPLRGEFRIVGGTSRGERELTVVYTGGLEGSSGRDVSGVYWRKIGLTATACQPFAAARKDRLVEFATAGGAGPFLGSVGGTNALWPGAIASSAVIGENMRVQVTSEVPVYPTVELVGPMDSFTGTLRLEDSTLPPFFGGQSWSVSIPTGVPAGSTLRLVTDPRARSIRMDGQLAAGRVARGSTLRPFYPGVNVLDVSAPGGTEETRVRIRWRELHRSIW
ncbi:hypothetical protein [Modestobacter sp. VKM Ac-2985]|uniref:hypothetical protein n=1 Tax=Modestobacter sp. VKM Ac-2985 TaxID=3004139 RepID=UPI0022AB8DDF|nr:hypothetical protein [Modestobacter sp. VKM Ac-2985]MCZ2837134.1 hypothetical protein [Modestobacter sp. VKM Ac-2985]